MASDLQYCEFKVECRAWLFARKQQLSGVARFVAFDIFKEVGAYAIFCYNVHGVVHFFANVYVPRSGSKFTIPSSVREDRVQAISFFENDRVSRNSGIVLGFCDSI